MWLCISDAAALDTGFQVVHWIEVALAASVVVAIAVGLAGKWHVARRLARAVVLACIVPIAVVSGLLIYGFDAIARADSSSNKTKIGQLISCAMNCGVSVLPILIVGGLVWVVATWRTRSIPSPSGPLGG